MQHHPTIAGISFEAGADTTKNTLVGFIKAMVLFPEAQKLAQKEIEEVVGGSTLPGIEHYDRLPYIRRTVKEALRWMPTAITRVVLHATRANDYVNGYLIPKGATTSLAVWSCNNDPNLFNDPRVFNPARHNVNFSIGQAAVADMENRDMWTSGRRICPGLTVAERPLFLSIAGILWAFDITPANGVAIDIDRDAVTQSIGACPMPFQCEIEKAEELLDVGGNYTEYILNKQTS